MTDFLQHSVAESAGRAPHWLQSLRARGQQHWESAALPTRRTEAWKYTSLNALRDDYAFSDAGADSVTTLPEAVTEGFSAIRLVFVDGAFSEGLSRLPASLEEGVTVCRFANANDEQAALIAEHLATSYEDAAHPFAALNTASLADGVFVHLDSNVSLTEPVEILWVTAAADGAAIAANQRLLLRLDDSAEATVIEHFVSDDTGASFTNGLSELQLSANAKLAYYRLHEEAGDAIHIGGVHTTLQRDANLNAFHLALGSQLKRLDLVVNHAGPGAHATLNGVYLPRGEEHIDFHTTIEHAVPHCTSDEVFRGIIADKASAVFNGRIHIHPDAQKTFAQLSNKNLLTSSEAQINTKPELEIYADDVQCAHGATVAQLDESALHYLRTRGVSRDEAEVMMSFGFINELIDGLELDVVRQYLRPLLAARFARETELARHLL